MRSLLVCCLVLTVLPVYAQSEFDPVVDSAWMNSRSLLWETGDTSFTKDLIVALQPVPFTGPRSRVFSPRDDAERFSLQWPLLLDDYYRFTGDETLIRSYLPVFLKRQFHYFRKLESERGLLDASDAREFLVNWPEGLREGFDYELASQGENAVVNAFYCASLDASVRLMESMGYEVASMRDHADTARHAFRTALLDESTGLFKDAPDSSGFSIHTNAIALSFGLVEEKNIPAVLDFVSMVRLNCHSFLKPYVVEACFQGGNTALGSALAKELSESLDTTFLRTQYVLGLTPTTPGWKTITVSPDIPLETEAVAGEFSFPGGRISYEYNYGQGLTLTVPPETAVVMDLNEGEVVNVKSAKSHLEEPLSESHQTQLSAAGWADHVGDTPAIWVAIDEQMLRLIRGDQIVFQSRCATAAKGVGSTMNSLKTPLGWHSIATKIGDKAPRGQVFRSRQATHEIWSPGDDVDEDLVLTRVLLLTGEEPGKNKGGDVDSFARNIYIHGTNDEGRIGVPSSHGCVRMLNDDIISMFPLIEGGTPVLLTDGPNESAASEANVPSAQ